MVAVLKGRAEEHVLSRIKQLLCAMWITFAITGPVRAAFEIVDGGAYAMSMGGALSAEIGSAETIWFNPAASAKLNMAAMMFEGNCSRPLLKCMTESLYA